MNTTALVATVVGTVVGSGCAVVRLWLRLSFLRRVYEHRSDRKDLEVAGKATTPDWTARAGRTAKLRTDLDASGEPGVADRG